MLEKMLRIRTVYIITVRVSKSQEVNTAKSISYRIPLLTPVHVTSSCLYKINRACVSLAPRSIHHGEHTSQDRRLAPRLKRAQSEHLSASKLVDSLASCRRCCPSGWRLLVSTLLSTSL